MIDFGLLFSSHFWFSIAWNPLQFSTAIIMAVFFAALTVAGIVVWGIGDGRARTRGREYQIALAKIGTPGIVAGLLGLLFTFTAYEQIAIFSARFWFLVVALLFVVWEIFSVRWMTVEVPKVRAARAERAEINKYMPKKKK